MFNIDGLQLPLARRLKGESQSGREGGREGKLQCIMIITVVIYYVALVPVVATLFSLVVS